MKIKKTYSTPEIHSESIKVGVFGRYGGGGGPIGIINPFFGICCS